MAIHGSSEVFPVQVLGSSLVFAFALAFALAALGGCESPGAEGPARKAKETGAQRLTVASWNLQAFFDGQECGGEYEDYLSSASWSEAKYRARAGRLAEAVAELSVGGPDVLALQEVENAPMLRDLAANELERFGYRWTAFAREEGGSLGVGLLSRRPLSRVRSHSVAAWGEKAPRPMLEATVDSGGASLVLFVCHWKSKLGGERETEPSRRASASVLSRRFAELEREANPVDAIALGDLNENCDEFWRRGGTEATALLPDLSEAARAAGYAAPAGAAPPGAALPGAAPNAAPSGAQTFIVLSGERPPRARAFPGVAACFSPWFDEAEGGSYAYRGSWETIDHALLPTTLFDGKSWEYVSFRVMRVSPFVRGNGFPDGYDPRTGNGLSDHLPILVELTFAAP
jgi:endonuclease/exonuclease/phosphatase family metal-dependent hydrolase